MDKQIESSQFASDIKKAADFHGHICAGIVFGVRIARMGLNYLGIDDPAKNRDFIVFVEADRCLTDAVQSVTGCSLGKRRLKWYDYGKMAASFWDINAQKGVRVSVVTNKSTPEGVDPVAFWQPYSDEDILKLEPITVVLKPEDLPGKPLRKAKCSVCGELINDGREVVTDKQTLCKPCADGAYYVVNS